MMTDPIADMLTRIRNANSIHRATIKMPASRMRVGIANVLKVREFIEDYKVTEQALEHPDHPPQVQPRRRARDPARSSASASRAAACTLVLNPAPRSARSGYQVVPPRSVSDRQAREMKVGGEILASIY
ncbi:MAG: 30S ribosomal protein S8 [Planctomycetota bacterium]